MAKMSVAKAYRKIGEILLAELKRQPNLKGYYDELRDALRDLRTANTLWQAVSSAIEAILNASPREDLAIMAGLAQELECMLSNIDQLQMTEEQIGNMFMARSRVLAYEVACKRISERLASSRKARGWRQKVKRANREQFCALAFDGIRLLREMPKTRGFATTFERLVNRISSARTESRLSDILAA